MNTTTNLNADGSLRIENEFASNGRIFRKTITLSDVVTVKVDEVSATMSIFDAAEKTDTKVFAIGEYAAAIEWAANRIADFQFVA